MAVQKGFRILDLFALLRPTTYFRQVLRRILRRAFVERRGRLFLRAYFNGLLISQGSETHTARLPWRLKSAGRSVSLNLSLARQCEVGFGDRAICRRLTVAALSYDFPICFDLAGDCTERNALICKAESAGGHGRQGLRHGREATPHGWTTRTGW